VGLLGAREEGGQKRALPMLPPKLRAKLEKLEIWLFLTLGPTDIFRVLMGIKMNDKPSTWKTRHSTMCPKLTVQVEAGHVVESQ